MNGSPQGENYLGHGSPASVLTSPSAGFTLNVFGHKVVIPEYAPGWINFWLLMATGCGIVISEEALNIWVCPLYWLAYPYRVCCLWMEHGSLLLNHSPEMHHTYYRQSCGCTGECCLSDMIPFYLGKLFKQSGAYDDVCSKLGIGKEKAMEITRVVQRYGNLAGFVIVCTVACSGAFFSWSEKSYSFPSRNTGCFSRILLCWSLLWWLDHPSASVSDWVLVEGAPLSCRCNSCICSCTLDGVPIRSSCINCIVPFSPTPLLQLVLLTTVCSIHKSQWQNGYKLPKSMIRRHRFILPMVAATLC
ncbi:hypothetical protein RHMOL_Rhmol01G0342300 [Rhododendron molle]|uniref:Uncharacterized protein n=1 Tax=Rhododendron molle TaxID=49168 RepID=A0ACC0Q898_RHOML|nr:hypothetical protein RHMOL_Rhmol01G0342300 [Rhododendron molle]